MWTECAFYVDCKKDKEQGYLPAWFEKLNNKYTGKDGKKILLHK